MYPYFSRFQPEDDQRFWFYNSMHFPEVVPAFDGITSEIPYTAIGANTARLFSFPTTMGIEYRILNGRVYITANPVLDEAEQGKRFADFQERAGHYYGNWDRIYGEWQQRIEALIAEIEAVEVPELGDLDPLEVVTGGRGFASNHFLRENFHRCIDLYSKMWHHHTELLMLGLRRLRRLLRVLQAGVPRDGRPDGGPHGRRHGRHHVPAGRRAEEARRTRRRARPRRPVRRGRPTRRRCWPRSASAARPAPGGWPRSRRPRTRGSTSRSVTASTTTTCPGPTTSRCPSPPCRATSSRSPPARTSTRPTERLAEERDRIANEYRALLGSDEEQGGLRPDAGPVPAGVPLHRERTSSTASTGSRPASSRRSGPSGRCWPSAACCWRPTTSSTCGTWRSRTPSSTSMLAWASGGTELGARHWQPIVAERKRIVEALSRLVAAARARPGSRGAQRPGREDALGHHPGDHRDLARRREDDDESTVTRLRGLTRRGRGRRPGAAQRQRHRRRSARARSSSAR